MSNYDQANLFQTMHLKISFHVNFRHMTSSAIAAALTSTWSKSGALTKGRAGYVSNALCRISGATILMQTEQIPGMSFTQQCGSQNVGM